MYNSTNERKLVNNKNKHVANLQPNKSQFTKNIRYLVK